MRYKSKQILHNMEYIELKIAVSDQEQAEIFTAELADYPFEAFDGDDEQLRAYIVVEEYDGCRAEIESMLQSWSVEWSATNVEQQNWNAEWESSFEAVDVEGEPMLRIRAEHHTSPAEGVLDVVIAPRMSFGTGHHITTALMSRTIADSDVSGLRGLDMGCGTGVLAIVALKCGAKSMVAVDIDEWACDSCRDSIALSGVAEAVDVRCGSMAAVEGEQFDFILANINRNILVDMMPAFAAALREGGRLFMSGFLIEDVAVIRDAAAQYDIIMESDLHRDGWAVVVCRKS